MPGGGDGDAVFLAPFKKEEITCKYIALRSIKLCVHIGTNTHQPHSGTLDIGAAKRRRDSVRPVKGPFDNFN